MQTRQTLIAFLLGLSQIAQGATMLAAPAFFYRMVPGVDETGPLNPHLMRDAGCAFLLAGAGLVWFARRPLAWPACVMGAAFLCLHALMHAWDGLAGRERLIHLAHDLPLMGGMAGGACWVVWRGCRAGESKKVFFSEEKQQKTFISCFRRFGQAGISRAAGKRQRFFGSFFQERTLLHWYLRRRIAAFEAAHGYDMTYARELLATDRGAFLAFARVLGMSGWRRDVPPAAYFAAKIAATITEDCGACTQLAVTMAERAGCADSDLRAVLAGDTAAMSADARLGWQFAGAVLAHDPDAAALRGQIATLWGQRAVISLSFAITAGRLFPTLKYGLGHGIACARVQVTFRGVPETQPA